MKYCSKCGAEIAEEAVVCVKCGAEQNVLNNPKDKGGCGWGCLGFFVPVVGLILYIMWRDSHPKNAKASGIGAIVSVIMVVLFYIVYVMLLVVMFVEVFGFGPAI